MATWDLETIRKKVRNLTGMQGVSQISDTDLNDYINRYYQYLFPLEVKPRALQGYYELDLTDGDDEYDLNDAFYLSYTSLTSTSWISSGDSGDDETEFYELSVFMDPETFYDVWPLSSTYTETRPTAVLIWENKLIFRATPDEDYRFKIKAWERPAELEADGDEPVQVEWGPVIATGSALSILEEMGDSEGMQRVQFAHQKYLNSVNSIGVAWLGDRRAAPSF